MEPCWLFQLLLGLPAGSKSIAAAPGTAPVISAGSHPQPGSSLRTLPASTLQNTKGLSGKAQAFCAHLCLRNTPQLQRELTPPGLHARRTAQRDAAGGQAGADRGGGSPGTMRLLR